MLSGRVRWGHVTTLSLLWWSLVALERWSLKELHAIQISSVPSQTGRKQEMVAHEGGRPRGELLYYSTQQSHSENLVIKLITII